MVRYVKMAARNVDTTLLEDATRRGQSFLFLQGFKADVCRSKRREEVELFSLSLDVGQVKTRGQEARRIYGIACNE